MSVIDHYKELTPATVQKLTYKRAFRYWHALLSDKVISLFDWKGLPFPQREIEIRTQLFGEGFSGVVKSYKLDRLIAVKGSGVGVTEYPDVWLQLVYATALDSGKRDIGVDAVLIRNNSLLLPSAALVKHYAHLLAHCDLTLQAILINSRATGYSTAANDVEKKRVEGWYKALENGSTEVIMTESDLNMIKGSKPIDFITTTPPGNGYNILDIWQASQNILKDFYTAIGISKPTDKRERLISDEVAQEQPLFKFNVEDMLDCRKEAAEQLNKVFGLTVSVDYAESLRIAQGGNTDVNAEMGSDKK